MKIILTLLPALLLAAAIPAAGQTRVTTEPCVARRRDTRRYFK